MPFLINTFRTFAAFESQLNKGILLDATTYVLPSEICSMVNVVLDAKNQSVKLCAVDGVDRVRRSFQSHVTMPMYLLFQHKYHSKIDDSIEKTSTNMRLRLCGKLITVLEKTLGKLSSFDEGSVTGMLLGFAVTKFFFCVSSITFTKFQIF